ncbi:MAG: sigma-70 family RNA polymerase sigma factor [Gemmatimonadetes bacterium]|nr:sigma-70 family RNA polymerase sigma factor [Gemmatimonadota bacterium]
MEAQPLIPETTRRQLAIRHLPLPELIAAAREGGNAAIGELVRVYAADIRTRLEGFAGEATDEVITDTFMSLPERLKGYRDEGKFERWLLGVAFNLARTRRRSAFRRERHEGATLRDVTRLPSAAARVHEAELMEVAQDELSPAEREVWFLSYQGFDAASISELLHLKPNVIAVRLHRARARLAEHGFAEA